MAAILKTGPRRSCSFIWMITGNDLQDFISLTQSTPSTPQEPISFKPLQVCSLFRWQGCFISHDVKQTDTLWVKKKNGICTHKRRNPVVQGMRGKLPAGTHYTLQQHTSVLKRPRHPFCVISRSVKLRSALLISLSVFLYSVLLDESNHQRARNRWSV